jgi:hypothetical protein
MRSSDCICVIIGINYTIYSVIKKDRFNFVRPYFVQYTWYVNYLHNI